VTPDPGDSGGCGCSIPGRSPLGATTLLLAAGVACLGARRARVRRSGQSSGRA
jgi:hypothetical protein